MNDEIWDKIRRREKLTESEIDELIDWRLNESELTKTP